MSCTCPIPTRLLPLLAVLAATSCRIPYFPPPDEHPNWDHHWHGHVSYPLGYRQTSEDFGDADELANFGLLDLDVQPPGFPVALAFQILGAYTEDVPDESLGSPFADADETTATQINLGLRKTWYTGPFQHFIGGGVSLVDVTLYEDSHYYYHDREFDSDTDVGWWAGAGVNYSPGGGFLLGIAAQYLFDAEVELAGQELDASGFDVLLLIGYSF